MATKCCARCKEEKSVDEFKLKIKNRPEKGLASYCTTCFREAAKESARRRKPGIKDRNLRSKQTAGRLQTCEVRYSIHDLSCYPSTRMRDQLRSRYCVGMWRRERLVAVSGADGQKWAAAEDLSGMPESDQSDSKRTD